jgi:hypothetical protein
MAKLLSINELNSYSRLVYDNNKSTLDAAFELLLDPTYSEKITSPIFKNQTAMFIMYIYSIVYFQLLSDSDNNMLYLSGNHNDLKLFAYNIIYLFDNLFDELNSTMDTQQYSIYSDTFNYIVSEYLSNCNSRHSGNINMYKKDITDFINNIYEYDYELIESDNDTQHEDWEIYIYVICYNYICLFQDIQNDTFIPKYISNIKHYLSSCIIVYCMNIIIQDSHNMDDINYINDFLNENPYFSDIIDSVQTIFYQDDDIRFQITNCPELFELDDIKDEKLLEILFNDVTGYYTYKPSKLPEINNKTLYKFERHQYYLCKILDINKVDVFEGQINEIKRRMINHGSLKNFYQMFLNNVTVNSDKINLIKEKNIYLLNKKFEECFYSLILIYHEKDNDDNYKKRIIINLCDNINNINLNDNLNKNIYEITRSQARRQAQNQTLDEYFFNDFNIHFKLQQMENYQKSNYTETFCDAFYFPNNLLLPGIEYENLNESNIRMGLFNLTEKNSPPIKLETIVLFDTDPDNTYCKMEYNLVKKPVEFTK